MKKSPTYSNLSSSLASIRQTLSRKNSVYVLYGEDSFLNRLILEIILKDQSGIKFIFPEQMKDETSLREEIFSPSLFSRTEHLILFDVQKKKIDLKEFLKKAPMLSKNVFLEFKGKTAPSFSQKNKEFFFSIACTVPKPYETPIFIGDVLRFFGFSQNQRIVYRLSELLSQDLLLIYNEIKKLRCLTDTADLSEEFINAHLCTAHMRHIFELKGALLQGKAIVAQRIMTQLLATGESILGIIGFLAHFYRTAIQVKEVQTKGQVNATAAVPYYVLKEYNTYVRNQTLTALQNKLSLCACIDSAVKTSNIDQEVLLSTLIV